MKIHFNNHLEKKFCVILQNNGYGAESVCNRQSRSNTLKTIYIMC